MTEPVLPAPTAAFPIDVDDLAHLAGAPFTDEEVATAAATLRAVCGWHIAPLAAETVTVDVQPYELRLQLPTRKLVSVEEVRDADTDTVIAATTYRVSHALGCVVRKSSWWPSGCERVEADITHGYATVPQDLWPLIAEIAATSRRDQTVKAQTAGVFTVTYGDTGSDNPLSTRAVLDRYMVGHPGIA